MEVLRNRVGLSINSQPLRLKRIRGMDSSRRGQLAFFRITFKAYEALVLEFLDFLKDTRVIDFTRTRFVAARVVGQLQVTDVVPGYLRDTELVNNH